MAASKFNLLTLIPLIMASTYLLTNEAKKLILLDFKIDFIDSINTINLIVGNRKIDLTNTSDSNFIAYIMAFTKQKI